MEFIQCLVFLETSCGSSITAENHSSGSTSSEESYSPKKYVLFSSKLPQNHLIYETFLKAGIRVIGRQIDLPKNSKFEFFELLIRESQRKKSGVSRLVAFVEHDFHHFFVTELLGEHCVVRISLGIGKTLSAVDGDNSVLIEQFLAHEVNIRHFHRDGGTLVHFAVKSKDTVLMKLLLKYGVNINARMRDNSTGLHIAVRRNAAVGKGDLEMVKVLVESGANLNLQNADGSTSLHLAVNEECVDIVKYLLCCGASPNVRSNLYTSCLGATSLHLAICKGCKEIMLLLPEKGANVNAECYDGRSALYLAVQYGRREMCQRLAEHGLDVNHSGNKKAFQLALFSDGVKYYEMVLCLLRNGFDVSAEDSKNLRVLFGAISKNLHEIVEKLLKLGASVNKFLKVGDRQWPMLQLAAARADGEMIQLLLDHGGHINSDVRGRSPKQTPLLVAIEHSNIKTLKVLLANNANCRESGAMVLAVDQQCPQVVLLLLENGAHVNRQDSNGRTPMLAAAFKDGGSRELLDMLVKFGARCTSEDITSSLSIPDSEYPSIPQNTNFQALLDYSFSDFDRAIKLSVEKLFKLSATSWLYSTVRKYAKELAHFVVKIEAAYGSVGPEIPTELHRCKLSNFKNDCQREIERMKLAIIAPTQVSWHDILTKQTYQVSRFVRDENILRDVEAFESQEDFPIYASILKSQIRKGIWRRQLLKLGIKLFKILFRDFFRLPDDIKEKVVDLVSNQDILILQKCLNVKDTS